MISVTGYPSRESAEAMLRLGIDAYIGKPFDIAELQESARPAIERRCAMASNRAADADTETEKETVLVVDSVASDRAAACAAIELLGFEVLPHGDPGPPLRIGGLAGAVLEMSACGDDLPSILLDLRGRDSGRPG